ncbi:MAG: TIGR04283 family arsenosugar biosynthesis glycosyltransferase [Desulfobacterales bacterium]|nr:TIGR04283 family arsenosugar biosynthesis glycosyltransferase [Desulfobacterales bacterium]
MASSPQGGRPMIKWGLSAGIWLAAVTVLARLGPIGRAPWSNAGLYLAAFAAMLALMRYWPRSWSFRTSLVVIFFLALAGRLLFWAFPVSNDVYRYIWEGYIQLWGYNPYLLPPDSPELTHLIFVHIKDIWAQINHKDLTAAYPPLTLIIFRFLASLSLTTAPFKSAMIGFDLLLVVVLAFMLRNRRLPVRRLILYAANPLVLVYVAGEAHLDVIQAALLMLGIAMLERDRPPLGFFLCGMAVMVKYLSLAVFPFILTLKNKHAWPFALLALVCFIPFADAGSMIFHSLLIFGREMHYNDGLPVILRFLFYDQAVWISILMLSTVWGVIFLTVPDRLRSIYLAIGALLVFLPTLHPWYLLLILPFMVFFPSRPWLFLCAAMVLTFPVVAIEFSKGYFQEIYAVKPLIYLPFAVLLVHAWHRRDEDWSHVVYAPPDRVAVVIPTLNEAAAVAAAVDSARIQPEVTDIVVADGGSTDNTVALARQAGARVVSAPQGRGHQIRAGIDHTDADVIVVLHADSRLEMGAAGRMLAALAAFERAPGGAFGMQFDGRSRTTRWIARLNHWRTVWTGISFGDQAQFFRRSALNATGGFPACMLMEDVELALRLKRIGRPLYVAGGIRVSDRRWGREGLGGNVLTVLRLFFSYLLLRRLGVDLGDNDTFYRRYYRRHQADIR